MEKTGGKITVDFHTHTFPDAIAEKVIASLKSKSHTMAFCNGTVGDLSEDGKKCGITLSVVLPVVTNPLSAEKINIAASKLNLSTAETGVFSIGGIHPDTPDLAGNVALIKKLGLKGIKIHPAYQQVPLNDIRYKRIISLAEENGLFVITHGGLDIGIPGDWCSPSHAAEILKDVRPTRFVMAHMGGWEQWDAVEELLVGQNVFFDTSFSLKPYRYDPAFTGKREEPLGEQAFLQIVKNHGADKILFGTDSPWTDRAEQLSYMKNLPLPEEEKDKILGENAVKMLNLQTGELTNG